MDGGNVAEVSTWKLPAAPAVNVAVLPEVNPSASLVGACDDEVDGLADRTPGVARSRERERDRRVRVGVGKRPGKCARPIAVIDEA